jgi:glucan phosphoethanolaminetransferase (alkaline phosphatase superfamily)
MLQRIQSLFLLVAAIAMVVFLGTNSFVKELGPNENVVVNPYHVFHAKGQLAMYDKPLYYIAVLGVLAFGLSIFTIFQYKNRLRQMLLVALNSLLIGVALAATVWHIQKDALLIGDPSNQGAYSYGMWAAFIALACNWIANRFIKRDEKLVKDADRMR